MLLHRAVSKIIVVVFFSTVALYGCARPKPAPLRSENPPLSPPANVRKPVTALQKAESASRVVNPFQELIVSLMLDSLDLLPKNISDKYFDAIMKGVEIPVQDDIIAQELLTSHKGEQIGMIAGLIAQRVYGTNVKLETVIPQIIIFYQQDQISVADLSMAAHQLSTSQDHDMDAYNACLMLLVNTLTANNASTRQKPRSGLYVRDANNNLYFHKPLLQPTSGSNQ